MDTSELKATLTSPARWLPVLLLGCEKWVEAAHPRLLVLIPTKHTGPVARLDLRQMLALSPAQRPLRWRRSSYYLFSGTYSYRLSSTRCLEQSKHRPCFCNLTAYPLLPWAIKFRPKNPPDLIVFLGHSEVRPHPRDLSVQLPTVVESPSINYPFHTLFSTVPLPFHPIQSLGLTTFLPRVAQNVVPPLSQNCGPRQVTFQLSSHPRFQYKPYKGCSWVLLSQSE